MKAIYARFTATKRKPFGVFGAKQNFTKLFFNQNCYALFYINMFANKICYTLPKHIKLAKRITNLPRVFVPERS